MKAVVCRAWFWTAWLSVLCVSWVVVVGLGAQVRGSGYFLPPSSPPPICITFAPGFSGPSFQSSPALFRVQSRACPPYIVVFRDYTVGFMPFAHVHDFLLDIFQIIQSGHNFWQHGNQLVILFVHIFWEHTSAAGDVPEIACCKKHLRRWTGWCSWAISRFFFTSLISIIVICQTIFFECRRFSRLISTSICGVVFR